MSPRTKYFVYFIFFVFLGTGFYLRLIALEAVTLGEQEWITRDFDRAFNIVNGSYIPLAGPESNAGGRLPGPFMYFWLAIPLLFHKSYESIFIFNLLLNLASVAGLFFVLKKHFGLYFSILSCALLSISAHHIAAVNFPINPAFIFPFIVLFLGLLFDFAFKGRESNFPWLILLIALGIQFHYSMITLLAIPIVLAFAFKIQVSPRSMLKTMAILVICFLPYAIYKAQMYEPANDGTRETLGNYKPFSAVEFVKMIAVQNTIERIAESKPFIHVEPSYLVWARIALLSLAVYVLFLKALMTFRQKPGNADRKNIVLLALFLAPAWQYEIIQPFTNHYWYTYIFILPTVLILSQVTMMIFESLQTRKLQILLSISLVVILAGHAWIAHQETQGQAQNLQKSLTFGTYQNSKLFLGALMKALRLTPEEVLRRVYFLEFRPSSLNRLKFAYLGKDAESKTVSEDNQKSCYFVHEGDKHEQRDDQMAKALRSVRKELFIKDPTIMINSRNQFSFPKHDPSKVFLVDQYKPKINQSCYANAFNPFVTTKPIRDLLRQATFKENEELKPLFFEENFDSEGNLLSLKGRYILKNSSTQTPFRLTLSIDKKESHYYLKANIEAYYFWGPSNIQMSYLNIKILPIMDSGFSINPIKTVFQRIKQGSIFNILPKSTLASSPNFQSGWAQWSYNQEWRREFTLPEEIQLKKNQFYIDLLYEMNTELIRSKEIRRILYPTMVNLISPKKTSLD